MVFLLQYVIDHPRSSVTCGGMIYEAVALVHRALKDELLTSENGILNVTDKGLIYLEDNQ